MKDPGKRDARKHHSAGGVVISMGDQGARVPLIATRRGQRWGLPKGTVDDGETPADAAIREIREETGLITEIVDHLGTIEYFFHAGGHLVQKQVDFFLMRHRGGELRPQLSEIDDVRWFPIDEAIERESFDSERALLEKARDILRSQPPGETF